MRKLFISIFVAASIFSSCSDDLLDAESTTEVSADLVIKNESAIDALRMGMYSQMAYGGGEALYTLNLPILGDILGEDMVYGDTWYQVYGREYNFTSTENSSAPWQLWSKAYYIAEICNNILNLKLEDVSSYVKDTEKGDKLEVKISKYKAEALAVRGMVHTDVARFFARSYEIDKKNPCIPYIDAIQYTAEAGKVLLPERNTTEEVYNKAIIDLKAALVKLPTIASSSDSKYMTKNAVAAVLSRIYLDMAGKATMGAATDAKQIEYLNAAKDYAQMALAGVGLMGTHEYVHGGLSKFNAESILTFASDKDKYSKWRTVHSFHDNYDGMGDDFRADIPFVGNFMFDDSEIPSSAGHLYLDVRRLFFTMENDYPSNPSYIWVLAMNDDVAGTGLVETKFLNAYKGIHKIYANSEDTDMSKTSKGYYTYGKFPRKDYVLGSKRGSLGLGDYTYIRASEMWLNFIECEYRLAGGNAGLANLKSLIKTRLWGIDFDVASDSKVSNFTAKSVDDIYSALYAAKIDGLSGNALLERIKLERRLELFGEGHRSRDIKRFGLGATRVGYKGEFATSVIETVHPERNADVLSIMADPMNAKHVFIVPKNEQNVNPNLLKK